MIIDFYDCPHCGGIEWHTMQNLKSDEICCCCCGSVFSLEELEEYAERHGVTLPF